MRLRLTRNLICRQKNISENSHDNLTIIYMLNCTITMNDMNTFRFKRQICFTYLFLSLGGLVDILKIRKILTSKLHLILYNFVFLSSITHEHILL